MTKCALKPAVLAVLLAAGACWSGWTQAADAARGSVLYETRCNACHDRSVHNRAARKAKSFDALRAQVQRWSTEVGGSWSAQDIDDLTLYLNERYYRFKCPHGVCKASQASAAG